MARPRRPRALAELNGAEPRRINYDEPVPLRSAPVAPDDLTDAQRDKWLTVVGWLRALNLLNAADTATITAYATIAEKLDRLRVRMTNEPEVVRNPSTGLPMNNPVFDQWLKACTQLESLHGRLCLGMGPSARARAVETISAAPRTGGGADRLFNR